MDKPVRPSGPGSNRPGANRPGGNDRPNLGDRPGDRNPIGDRSNNIGNRNNIGDRNNVGNRVNAGNRNRMGDINVGDINVGNNVINNQPNWANIDRNQINNINNRVGNQIGGMQNWGTRHPDRVNHWNSWGNGVRNHWNYDYRNCFGPNWWGDHRHGFGGWHYSVHFHDHSPNYWWTIPTFAACTSFFNMSAPANAWSQPVYYDYGQGGNVVYENNVVYMNGEAVASAEEFAQSAAVLATVPPPASEEEAAAVEWMPLGTFAIATTEQDADPTRLIQLAVSREGIISGTVYNTQTDQAASVQGSVDPETQRVACRVGESEDIVVETGLYNLTQDDAPVLVHFGTESVENWLLVRLENPEEDQASRP